MQSGMAEVVACSVLTEEEIVRIRTITTDLKDLNQVEELAMNVANHSNGSLDVYHIALLHKKLLRLGAYCFDDRVCEELLFVQAADALVQIDAG